LNIRNQIKLSLENFKKDFLTNISVTGFIENNTITEVIEINNAYLIKGKSDVEWIYLVCKNEIELKWLLEKTTGDNKYFTSVEDWMIPVITKSNKPEWLLSAMRYYLPYNIEIPQNKIEVTSLTNEHIGFIISQSNYKQFLTASYVEERINKSISAAILKGTKLIAWGLTHDDGALGSLHVLDEYRKKGYGKEILISLINQSRQFKKVPFVQIEEKKQQSNKSC